MNQLERARNKYKPDKPRVIFVAEAPPEDISRFFYYEDVKSHDALFINLIRALYPEYRKENGGTVADIRKHKAGLLKRFQQDRYYLLDAIPNPISLKTSASDRRKLIKARQQEIANAIKRLLKDTHPREAGVVLIKSTVQGTLENYLRKQGLPVRNRSKIPFPLMGHAKQFAEGIHMALAPFERTYRIRTKFVSYDGDIIIQKAQE